MRAVSCFPTKRFSNIFGGTAAVAIAVFITVAATAQTAPPTGFQVAEQDSLIRFTLQGRPYFSYQNAPNPQKPYVKTFRTPSGIQVLRDSPADHVHHHSLMFAVAAGGTDFWMDLPTCGVQKPIGQPRIVTDRVGDVARGQIATTIQWLTPDQKEVVAREERVVTALAGPQNDVALLGWQTTLQPAEGRGPIELTGAHYYGLGLRMVQSMDQVGRFQNDAGNLGEIVRGEERVGPARWCAYTAPAEGKTVTVAIFDHPDNPRHPNVFFTMPTHFAYLSATLNLWKEPMTISAEKPLAVQYGIALWDGEKTPEQIEEVYRRWLELCK